MNGNTKRRINQARKDARAVYGHKGSDAISRQLKDHGEQVNQHGTGSSKPGTFSFRYCGI